MSIDDMPYTRHDPRSVSDIRAHPRHNPEAPPPPEDYRSPAPPGVDRELAETENGLRDTLTKQADACLDLAQQIERMAAINRVAEFGSEVNELITGAAKRIVALASRGPTALVLIQDSLETIYRAGRAHPSMTGEDLGNGY